MSGLDSISLDASGFLDMDSFTDGSDLPDDALAGLHDALLTDPVDEPSDADWSALVDDVVDVEATDDSGPFTVDDGDIAGVRDAGDDDGTSSDGGADGADQVDDDLALDDHDEPVDAGDDDVVDEGGADTDLETEVDASDLIGLDLLDLDSGDDGLAEIGFDVEPEPVADIGHDLEDLL